MKPAEESVKFADLGLKWKVGVIWMFTAVAANSYFAFTDSGLFPYVIELQMRTMGSAWSSPTFFLCLVPLLVPLFLVRSAVVRGLRGMGIRDPDAQDD